ncbi:uncharacterized protein METZ01_LOCUS116119, partial [marine metagenome]
MKGLNVSKKFFNWYIVKDKIGHAGFTII